jgi:sporulation integral membrane protein YlbJ
MAVALTIYVSVIHSQRIAHSVRSALSLLSTVVIPSVFPFMIIADMLRATLDFSAIKLSGAAFEKIFRISRVGIYPFILGALCGFPLGVRCVCELYGTGAVTKDEAQRLIGFCNNTGPAFLIAGVGAGLRGSLTDGIILYLSMLLSAVAVGFIFSFTSGRPGTTVSDVRTRFSLTESIRNAGLSTLTLCSYVSFFACSVGLLRLLLGETPVYLFLISFLEIGSACSIFSKTVCLTKLGSLLLSAFAVGFSGICVHLQAMAIISKTDLSCKKYYIMKLLQGFLATAICLLLEMLISNV